MSVESSTEIAVSPERLKEMLDAGEAQLVDVREPYEWAAGRIPGARHLEFVELSARAGEIDRDAPVVFGCRVGNRSLVAAQAFRTAGYDAYSLDGGLVAWVDSGLPLEPDGGRVEEH